MFNIIEKEIKKFKKNRDYYLLDNGYQRVYIIHSDALKEAVCPFPKILGINGGRKSEREELGNYFSYEEGANGSPDKFTVRNSEVSSQKSKEIKKLDKKAKEWDKQAVIWDNEAAKWDEENSRIAQNHHPRTVSFSIYDDKEEKVFERTKTSTYCQSSSRRVEESIASPRIQEISEEEAQRIESEWKKNKEKSELDTKNLEIHQPPKK